MPLFRRKLRISGKILQNLEELLQRPPPFLGLHQPLLTKDFPLLLLFGYQRIGVIPGAIAKHHFFQTTILKPYFLLSQGFYRLLQ